MPLTIYDISKKANVSIATVSRVLNGSTNVRESTRQKVMDIINEYDFTPNASARAMTLRSQHTIGILCADSSDIFLAKAVYYLEQELQAHGYESILCCTGYNQDIKENYINLILSKKVDGIILVGSNFIGNTDEENKYIANSSSKVPIMLLNASFDYDNVYSTLCEDISATKYATNEMIASGTKDVIFLYNSYSYSCSKKKKGFIEACEQNNLPDINDRLCYINPNVTSIPDIIEAIREYASSHPDFHGVIASDDTLGIAAVKYAHKQGLTVPKDFQVIGYNNSILTECCSPELSSVDNHLETQTRQLIKTLIGVISNEEMPKKTTFSGSLIKRGTTRF